MKKFLIIFALFLSLGSIIILKNNINEYKKNLNNKDTKIELNNTNNKIIEYNILKIKKTKELDKLKNNNEKNQLLEVWKKEALKIK